jgi:hypothetical protein
VSLVKNRVQGIDSSLNDLTLHDGRKLALEIGGAVQRTPTLTRTIAGSSSIGMTLRDHELAFLDSALLAEKLEAQLDGLWFRYMGAELDPPDLTLTFEDRDVARLREFSGPKKAYRAKTTRAEFVIKLVKEALPNIPITCPQLHVKQPIKTPRQSKKAKESAKEERGKGLTEATKGLKVKGEKATPAQVELGDRAIRIADHLNAPFKVQVALIAALIVESEMGSLSHNVLQALGPGGAPVGTVEEEVTGFLTGKNWTIPGGAIGYFKANPQAEPYVIAQAVQLSGAGEDSNGAANYGPVVAEARDWVTEVSGGEGSTSLTVTEPYVYEVHKDEDYWTAVKRLGKEVNWRAFFVAHRFFFIDEIELMRGMVRLAIDRDTPGVEKVSFSFNANRPATEVTVSAFAGGWTPPPGSVVTLAGYGPASLGSGDAPVKANAKGQKQGVDRAQKAMTGEGRGRYLVETIEAPIRDSDVSDLRLITIKVRKPTAPLPEPAAKTRTETVGTGASATTDSLSGVSIPSTKLGPPAWGGTAAIFKQFIHPFMEEHGLKPGAEKEEGHTEGSDHALYSKNAYATDYPTSGGAAIANALGRALGRGGNSVGTYDRFDITVDGHKFSVQILWAVPDHYDHVHVGLQLV